MPPRFSPREFVQPQRAFWDDAVAGTWFVPRTPEEATQLLVAKYLSEVSRSVVRELMEAQRSRKDFAESFGESPSNLSRKLNGEYPAKFEDILRWAVVLDRPDVIFAPGDVGDLAPEGLIGTVRDQVMGRS